MVIISILLGFILNAAMEGVKRGQERATQSLITKLEAGLNDRLNALLETRPDANQAHRDLAAIYNVNTYSTPLLGLQREQVIAWVDLIKSELPDVFMKNTGSAANDYPFNFAANPFPPVTGNTGYTRLDPYAGYVLPLGNSIRGVLPGNAFSPQGTGIFGASYPAAAGIYKNLGYLPQGYDGIDNDGNGLIDELAEGIGNDPAVPTPEDPNVSIKLSSLIQARFANHQHITARSEMLYALLVEGRGPLGSVFNKDEFTDKEVQDTDGDGLPEFVDAWGNPLQFYRWPLLYHSDIQRGQVVVNSGNASQLDLSGTNYPLGTLVLPYRSIFEEREQNPLDLNQHLVAPAWWTGFNSGPPGWPSLPAVTGPSATTPGAAVGTFEFYFHRLREPYGGAAGTTPFSQQHWDRGSYPARRAFYSKFLIVSAGLDEQLGIFGYYPDQGSPSGPPDSTHLLAIENNAMPLFYDLVTNANIPAGTTVSSTPFPGALYDLSTAAQDDISNQNIQTTIGIGGGG
jgi:hypothetical protein